jgi:hypothetical protein
MSARCEMGEDRREAAAESSSERIQDQVAESPEAGADRVIEHALGAEADVSPDVERLAAETDGQRVGAENVFKKRSRLTDKIRGAMEEEGLTATEAAERIGDALRYAITYPDERYAERIPTSLDRLRARGYAVEEIRNSWVHGSRYKGVNVSLRTPDGQPFELQFHTPHSWVANQRTHADFERFRTLPDTSPEAASLREQMVAQWDGVEHPPGIERIGKPQGR